MSVFDLGTKQLMQVGSGAVSCSGIRADVNNLAPRLGFAWAATHKAVVRGGYWIFYNAGMLVVNSALLLRTQIIHKIAGTIRVSAHSPVLI